MENYNPNDFNPYENPENRKSQNIYPYGQQPVRRVQPVNFFETAAWASGIAGILSCMTVYGAYILGSLAIIFALLSRGVQMHMGVKAKRGLMMGILAIVLTTILFIAAFHFALQEFGSIEGIVREFCDMYGYDFEEMFGDMFPQ